MRITTRENHGAKFRGTKFETVLQPKLSELKTELDLRHPLDIFTKDLLKSTQFRISNADDINLCGDCNSEPILFRENLNLVLKSLSKIPSNDGINELIDNEIGQLIEEEINLVENCNLYTYQDIPKEPDNKFI